MNTRVDFTVPTAHLRGPSFKGGDSKESHHGHEDIVKVEVAVVPDPLLRHRQRCIPVVVQNVGASGF